MLMSWQCTLGKGTTKTAEIPEAKQDEHQRLNFLGHPEVTRHLIFCALRETYANDEDVLTDALLHIATDFQHTCREGIKVRYMGEDIVLRLCCVCTKGDWPWLITAGNLNRSFRRAAKRSEASSTVASGLCHLCYAGASGIPCSDSTENALWMKTMGSAAASFAWDEPSPLTTMLTHKPDQPALFYRPDVFHNWHLGIGMNFVSSSLVILHNMCSGSIVNKFEELSALWRQWCRQQSFGYKSYSRLFSSCESSKQMILNGNIARNISI